MFAALLSGVGALLVRDYDWQRVQVLSRYENFMTEVDGVHPLPSHSQPTQPGSTRSLPTAGQEQYWSFSILLSH